MVPLLLLLFLSSAAGQPLEERDASNGTAVLPPSRPDAFIQPFLPLIAPVQPKPRDTVEWRNVIGQSFRFVLLQQGFRYATERGARHSHMPVFRGYVHSVTNLHGWADGDPFYVNYIGHPMEGAVAGLIWAQNDLRYLGVQFGRDPDYWRSRVRSAALACLYSFQFEIGPLSEASIGATQNYFPQQGLVDHVVTPVIGTGWIIAEDAVDRFMIRPFEGRVRNPYLRLLVRSGLNPSRSLANILAGRAPWVRTGRSGVFTYNGQSFRPQPSQNALTESYPEVAPVEFQAVSTLRAPLDADSGPCIGGGASAGFRLSPAWQIVVDVSGCKLTGLRENLSGDSLTYLIGPRWTPSPASRWSPYLQVLIGGNKVTQEEMYPARKAVLEKLARDAGRKLDFPDHALYTRQEEANGLSLSFGTGIDRKLSRALALRLASLDYSHSWVSPVNGYNYSSNLQLTAGLVLRMGTW